MRRLPLFLPLLCQSKKAEFSPSSFRGRKRAGFTVMELLVAASVFLLVMTTAVGMFVSATRAQRKIAAVQAAEENARFMLELLAKEIRVSEIQGNGIGQQTLQIQRNIDGAVVLYDFDGDDLTRDVSGDGVAPIPINGSDVSVSGVFDIRGTGAGDGQPTVTIVLRVEHQGRSGEGAEIRLQTTVAERGPDRSR